MTARRIDVRVVGDPRPLQRSMLRAEHMALRVCGARPIRRLVIRFQLWRLS